MKRRTLTALFLILPYASANNGYILDIQSFGASLGCKTQLGAIPGLQERGFTIGTWARYRESSTTMYAPEAVIVTESDGNFWNGFGGNGVNFNFASGNNFQGLLPEAAFSDWHHFAFRFDAHTGTTAQYVDGVQKASGRSVAGYSSIGHWTSLRPSLNIGMMCFGPTNDGNPRQCYDSRVFNGQLDDFAFWVGALTDQEITERWNSSLTERVSLGLEPDLALLYNFNDPVATPGHVPNVGTAGNDYDLIMGAVDGTAAGRTYVSVDSPGEVFSFAVPSFAAATPIPGKAPETAGTPLVVYAAAGTTIDLSGHGLAGHSFAAPVPFNATAALSLSTSGGALVTVHVVPLQAPQALSSRFARTLTTEDTPVALRLLPGHGHTWNGEIHPIITRLPAYGTLYEQNRWEDRLLTSPILATGHRMEVSSHIVLFVPSENGFGRPYDSFAVVYRLHNVSADGAPLDSPETSFEIDVSSVDDLPVATSTAITFDEDSQPDGLDIVLNLTDSELNQVLTGYISRLPAKGTLYAVNASGHRSLIDASFNPFDVGSPVLRQYVSRVLSVSSFWGSNPPYAGYHPLGILGPPDCERAIASNECASDLPWITDITLYPDIGTHVVFNGHRAIVLALDRSAGTVDVQVQAYFKKPAATDDWTECYMDVFSSVAYPAGCLTADEGGSSIPLLLTVPRADIQAFNAAVWCPERTGYMGELLMAGGGPFGPQYEYRTLHNETLRGQLPYTEFIEVAVSTPIYIFGVVIGMSRGAGCVVAIRARDPSKPPGHPDEWGRLYESEPLVGEAAAQVESGVYWKWSPSLCRVNFKTDTIRIELDTRDRAGDTWNYVDAVEVLGSEMIQQSVLSGGLAQRISGTGTTVAASLRVVYVPNANANGVDSFEYEASDCTGDLFRSSLPAVVSFTINPINDVPTQIVHNMSVSSSELSRSVLDFGTIVSDVETPVGQLVITITDLPPSGTFLDGFTPITRSALPHVLTSAQKRVAFHFDSLDGMANAPDEVDGELIRKLVTGTVAFTVTDPDNTTLDSELLLRIYRPELGCEAPNHVVEFEGDVPVCVPCPAGERC